MDWLNDKKNQPIIAAIAALVIVVVIIFVYLVYIREPSAEYTPTPQEPVATSPQPDATGAAPTSPTPGESEGMQPAQPAPMETAGAAQPAPGGETTTVASKPMETWRGDPFLPIGYKPPKKAKKIDIKQPIFDFPKPERLFPPKPKSQVVEDEAEIPQPPRRMAGLLLNNRVYAIIETNGKSEIVQPGDTLSDRLAIVEKIERDKVIIRSTSKRPKYYVIRMASAPPASSASSSQTGPTPGRPGGRGGEYDDGSAM